ncbi:MAG TPA: M1 family aminopeptidase, partial [Saprospiraceae bacterium]|nr:M1 family aminopeptidase [Saprospiraceae bacterium]
IPILNYVYPENLASAQAQTVSSLQIMGLYNELFGLYPFADEKYGHAQFGWGGGMEHQTMTFLVSFGYGLIAHEMAHQWFGDKVTCGSWAEIWLNEGFASYLTALTYERFSHDTYWPQWKSSTINSSTSQPGGSVYVNDTTSVDRIFSGRLSYNKASYVLHMLRWVTGDDAFFQACRDYLDNAGTAYDFGSTAELQGYMEAHSGVNLDEFFADWYYGQGFPSYNLKWLQQSDSLVVWINQTQSHPSVSYFEMPVPVWYYHNGNPEQAVLQNTTQDQRFAVYVGDTHIDSIRFDPDQWILSKNNTVTALISSTDTPSDNPLIRIAPNPANDILEISGDESITQIDFITAQGQYIRRNVNHGLVEVADFAPGYYTALLLDTRHQRRAVRPMMILH